MTELRWVATHVVETAGQLFRVPPFDERSGEHLWVMASAWRVHPQKWGTDPPVLDQENLLVLDGPGCFYCEEVYTERLARRRCTGWRGPKPEGY